VIFFETGRVYVGKKQIADFIFDRFSFAAERGGFRASLNRFEPENAPSTKIRFSILIFQTRPSFARRTGIFTLTPLKPSRAEAG
jgi:hypothetical protein